LSLFVFIKSLLANVKNALIIAIIDRAIIASLVVGYTGFAAELDKIRIVNLEASRHYTSVLL